MTRPDDRVARLLGAARDSRQRGRPGEAIARLEEAVGIAPGEPAALNALGLALLEAGRAADAVEPLRRATRADPGAPALHVNLADALRGAGDPSGALAALDAALARDPYFLPALWRKAQLLETLGEAVAAVRVHRALLKAVPANAPQGDALTAAIARARAAVERDGTARLERLQGALAAAGLPVDDRARAYVEQLCGLRQVYAPQPTGPHFPFLPAIEFFDPAAMPWLAELERGFAAIQQELLALWDAGPDGFDPYVRFDPTAPVNQWSKLNHSPDWSAFFLWRDGVRQEDAIRRCPATAAIAERLPLLDVPGKAPTVMFSILAPRTHIPPHTGVTNTRATVHLTLVAPPDTRFRVGGETRPFVEGTAWAFDDTIEHEAWNDSDQPRAILIVDAWNPFLSEAERDVVRLASGEMRL